MGGVVRVEQGVGGRDAEKRALEEVENRLELHGTKRSETRGNAHGTANEKKGS
jgi:hypothetical protein